jgi:hypothetical protein
MESERRTATYGEMVETMVGENPHPERRRPPSDR